MLRDHTHHVRHRPWDLAQTANGPKTQAIACNVATHEHRKSFNFLKRFFASSFVDGPFSSSRVFASLFKAERVQQHSQNSTPVVFNPLQGFLLCTLLKHSKCCIEFEIPTPRGQRRDSLDHRENFRLISILTESLQNETLSVILLAKQP